MEPYEVSEVSENTNPDVTLNAATTEAQSTTDSATVTEPEANEKTTEDVAAAPACAMTKEEIETQAKHWIGFSPYDAPEYVWIYPERI